MADESRTDEIYADEFYIGWEGAQPPGVGRRVRRAAVVLLVLAAVVALLTTAAQRPFSRAVFEFGSPRLFEGVIRMTPQPHLEVERPGRDAGVSRYLLVAPGKHGARGEVGGFAGRRVRLSGTLVYRGDETLLEVVPGSLEEISRVDAPEPEVAVGFFTVAGEIVDSKCFLGVMKPGERKVHRACASLCIRGGIPPLLVVDDADGPAAHLLLVGPGGSSLAKRVLDFVAEPVDVTGEVRRRGDLWIMEADPASIRRRK